MKYGPFPPRNDTWMKERANTQLTLVQCRIEKKNTKTDVWAAYCRNTWEAASPPSLILTDETSFFRKQNQLENAWSSTNGRSLRKEPKKTPRCKICIRSISVEPGLCVVRITVVKLWSLTNSIRVAWEFVRNTVSQGPISNSPNRKYGAWGPETCVFASPPGDSEALGERVTCMEWYNMKWGWKDILGLHHGDA